MQYDYIWLKSKIEMYLAEKITLHELGGCCETAYYETIKGGCFYLSNLLIYPLLKTLYRINIEPSDYGDIWPCSQAEIDSVYEILSGRRNTAFAIAVGIPEAVASAYAEDYSMKRVQYDRLKTVLMEYLETGTIEHDSARLIKSVALSKIKPSDTIPEYIESQILAFISNIQVEENRLRLVNSLGLYCTKRQTAQDRIRQIVCLIDCYTGLKNVNLQIIYTDGVPQLSAAIFTK